MENTTINQGPESPADLQWSQGAKNPRKEKSPSENDDIIGMLFSDTNFYTIDNVGESSEDDISIKDVDGTSLNDTTTDKGAKKQKPQFARSARSQRRHAKSVRAETKTEIIEQLHQGKLDWKNHPLLKKMSLDKLSIALQPRRKWYLSTLKKKVVVLDKLMKNPLLVAVLSGGNADGTLTPTQSDAIIERIAENIYRIPKGKFVPRFNDATLTDGILIVTSADHQSATWLTNQCFLNLWEAGTAQVLNRYSFEDLPRYLAYASMCSSRGNSFMELLTSQNPDLDVPSFIICKYQKNKKGVLLVWRVTEHTVNELNDLDMKPYFGVSKIEFIPFSDRSLHRRINMEAFAQAESTTLPPPKGRKRSRYSRGLKKNKFSVESKPKRLRPNSPIAKSTLQQTDKFSSVNLKYFSPNYLKQLEQKRYLQDYQRVWTRKDPLQSLRASSNLSDSLQKRLGSPPRQTEPKGSMTFSQYFESLKTPQQNTARSQTSFTDPEWSRDFNLGSRSMTTNREINQSNLSGFSDNRLYSNAISEYMKSPRTSPERSLAFIPPDYDSDKRFEPPEPLETDTHRRLYHMEVQSHIASIQPGQEMYYKTTNLTVPRPTTSLIADTRPRALLENRNYSGWQAFSEDLTKLSNPNSQNNYQGWQDTSRQTSYPISHSGTRDNLEDLVNRDYTSHRESSRDPDYSRWQDMSEDLVRDTSPLNFKYRHLDREGSLEHRTLSSQTKTFNRANSPVHSTSPSRFKESRSRNRDRSTENPFYVSYPTSHIKSDRYFSNSSKDRNRYPEKKLTEAEKFLLSSRRSPAKIQKLTEAEKFLLTTSRRSPPKAKKKTEAEKFFSSSRRSPPKMGASKSSGSTKISNSTWATEAEKYLENLRRGKSSDNLESSIRTGSSRTSTRSDRSKESTLSRFWEKTRRF